MSERRNPAESPVPTDSHDVPNRRDFLKSLFVAGATGAALLSGCAPMLTDQRTLRPQTGLNGANDKLCVSGEGGYCNLEGQIKRTRYGIEQIREIISIQNRYGIEFLFADSIKPGFNIMDTMQIIRHQLAKYPPDYLRNCGLTQIILRDINYGGAYVEIRGNKTRIGLPVRDPGWGIHHEIAHAVGVYHWSRKEMDRIKMHWINLNEGGLHAYDPSTCTRHVPRPAGFTSKYGSCNPGDDRAELANVLFKHPKLIEKICKEDPVVAKKVRAYKDELYRLTNGRMGPQYWDDLKAGKVNEAYWDKH